MLHHDAVYSPTLAQQGIIPGSKKPPSQKTIANQAQHLGYLENHRYEKFSQNDIEEVGDWGKGSKVSGKIAHQIVIFIPLRVVVSLLKELTNRNHA